MAQMGNRVAKAKRAIRNGSEDQNAVNNPFPVSDENSTNAEQPKVVSVRPRRESRPPRETEKWEHRRTVLLRDHSCRARRV